MSLQQETQNLSNKASQPGPLWTRSFIMLTLCYFLLFLCLQMLLSPFPSYVTERFNPGDFLVSLTTSLFALAAILARFATAALMKKVSRNVLLYTGLAVAALCTAAYPYIDSFAFLLVLRIGFGIGFGMGSTIMATVVSQIIPPNRLGEGIGYFGLSTSLAMSIGPLVGLTVLAEFGFFSLSVWGALAAAAAIPLLLLSRSLPPKSIVPLVHDKARAATSQRKRTFNARLLYPAALNVLLSITYGGLLGFLALYGKETGLEHIGLFFLFNAITVLVIRPLSGRLFDSRGHGAVLIPGCLFLAASLLILSYADQLPLLILSALLYGIGFGSVQPTLQAWMLSQSDPEGYGTTNSLFYNSIDFGVAIGSMILGLIASASSYAVMYRWTAGLMGGLLLIYLITETIRRNRINPA